MSPPGGMTVQAQAALPPVHLTLWAARFGGGGGGQGGGGELVSEAGGTPLSFGEKEQG